MPTMPPPDQGEVNIAVALGLDLERVVSGSMSARPHGEDGAWVEWTEWSEHDRMVQRSSTALTWQQLLACRDETIGGVS